MKIDSQLPALNQTGSVKLIIDNIEDYWVLSTLIQLGDLVFAPVRRKVTKVSKIGKSNSKQLFFKTNVCVTEICFQPNVDEMQIRGTLVEDNDEIEAKAGDYQRVLLERGRPFRLTKKIWDSFSLSELEKACDPTSDASVAAVIMENGISHICLVGKNMSLVLQKIQKVIPKVRKFGSSGKNIESKMTFFELTASALIDKISIKDMKCVIIASPGFLQHEFYQYLSENKGKYNLTRAFQDNIFITANVPTGHPCELDPLLASPEIAKYVSNMSVVQQAQAFDLFLRTLNKNPQKVAIGHENVVKEGNLTNIENLLVTNDFIIRLSLEERLKFLEFKEKMEQYGSKVVIFSTKHQSGEQLNQMGGIAAICRLEIVSTAEFDD